MNKKGFTLIELLVVIAIIGVLAGIMVVNFSNTKGKSADTRRISNLRTLRESLANYYSDLGEYPNTGGSNDWESICSGKNWMETYLVPDYLGMVIIDQRECSNCQGYEYTSDGIDYKIRNGCFQTDNYTGAGDSYDDPARDWHYGAVYTNGARNW